MSERNNDNGLSVRAINFTINILTGTLIHVGFNRLIGNDPLDGVITNLIIDLIDELIDTLILSLKS